MTEAEWLAGTDPMPMLDFLRGKATDRKLRLFACACARRLCPPPADDPERRAVEVAERYADGLAARRELDGARRAVMRANHLADQANELLAWRSPACLAWCATRKQAAAAARDAARAAAWYAIARPGSSAPGSIGWKMVGDFGGEWGWQADVLRDFFGNPFRPPPPLPPAVLAWNDGTVPRIAQTAYEERAFDRLPILADALLDAGCDDEELIRHCRADGPHVRGCWAVDLILGKS